MIILKNIIVQQKNSYQFEKIDLKVVKEGDKLNIVFKLEDIGKFKQLGITNVLRDIKAHADKKKAIIYSLDLSNNSLTHTILYSSQNSNLNEDCVAYWINNNILPNLKVIDLTKNKIVTQRADCNDNTFNSNHFDPDSFFKILEESGSNIPSIRVLDQKITPKKYYFSDNYEFTEQLSKVVKEVSSRKNNKIEDSTDTKELKISDESKSIHNNRDIFFSTQGNITVLKNLLINADCFDGKPYIDNNKCRFTVIKSLREEFKKIVKEYELKGTNNKPIASTLNDLSFDIGGLVTIPLTNSNIKILTSLINKCCKCFSEHTCRLKLEL